MNEIIPLKKDIIFKTKIGEITNISLDHDYKIDNDLITGSVDISGAYKMTEASILEEDFYYSMPFSIAISKKVQRDTIKIEIEDFDYSINKDVLSVKINLELTCEEEKEIIADVEEEIIVDEEESEINIKESENNIMDDYFNNLELNNVSDEFEENINTDNEIIKDNEIKTNITNITNNIINTENKYYTYKVYIVREGDTIETICNKYNVTINDLKEYNDINDIKIGDKIIIPSLND